MKRLAKPASNTVDLYSLKMMLLNLRSSVNWRHNTVAYLCGVGLFFLMSSASAQDTTLIYRVGASEGVWTERTQTRSIPVETGNGTVSPYETEASAMPAYDSATAQQQYEPSIETQWEAYREAYGDEAYGDAYGEAYSGEAYDEARSREVYGEARSREVYDDAYGEAYSREAYDDAYSREAYGEARSREAYGGTYGTYGTYDSWRREPAAPYSGVKNRDLFGVDEDNCCDEWSKFGNFKDLKYKGNCGGLKANKGHLGISWLRSADGGEDCDYCQGGCCEKGIRAAGRRNRATRRDVFSSAWSKATRSRCDECDPDNCPEEEGCTSCQ